MKRLPPLNALRAFHAASQARNFTLAGQALHVTQGAVSRQVKLLEETLGCALFVRVHQGVELTDEGRSLALVLDKAFGDIGLAVEHIQRKPQRDRLAINVPPTFATRWLAPRLAHFFRQYPLIDLQITTDWIRSVRDSQHVDCVVCFETQAWAGGQSTPLMLENHVMVASPELWTDGVPPTPQTQTLLHLLHGERRLPLWEQWINTHGHGDLDPQSGPAFSTLDQAIQAALNGAGLAIVDERMIGPELASGRLRRVGHWSVQGPFGYWFVNAGRDERRRASVALFDLWLRHMVELEQIPGAQLA